MRLEVPVGWAHIFAESARSVRAFSMDASRLIDVAIGTSDVLGRVLDELIAHDPSGPLPTALRSVFRLPERPSAGEWAKAFAAFCLRETSRGERLRGDAPIDPAIFERFGGQSALILQLWLSKVQAATPWAAARGKKKTGLIGELEHGLLDPSLAVLLKAVLHPTPADPRMDADLVERIASVESVRRQGTASCVKLSEIIERLTYNPIDLTLRLRAEIESEPRSALGGALLSFPGRLEGSADAATLSCLLALLDRFREGRGSDRVRLDRFAEVFGEAGREVALLVEEASRRPAPKRPDYESIADIITCLGGLLGDEHALRLVDVLIRKDDLIPKKLPALEIAKRSVKRTHFKGRGLCAIQHLFPSLIPVLEAYLEKGMRPEDIHVLGTPYATNPMVVAYARLKGLHLEPSRDDAGLGTRSFEERRLDSILGFLGTISLLAQVPEKGWVILDDGGLLNAFVAGTKRDVAGMVDVPAVRAQLARMFAGEKHGVEQTTRGLTELDGLPLDYVVIAVAKAFGKIEEGKLIGWSTTASLLRELRWRGALPRVKRIVVKSGGTVGIEAAEQLRRLEFDVTVIDTSAEKRAAAKDRGFKTAARFSRRLREATDVALGITGKRAFQGQNMAGFKGIVASGSSAAVEGDVENLLAFGRMDVVNMLRPVNFAQDGHEMLSPKQIGNTQALLFLGAAQEDPSGQTGVQPLKDQPQAEVVEYWRSHGGLDVEPLRREERTELARPDTLSVLNGARHRDWMTYFRNFAGEIFPPPTSARYAPSIYCFREPGEAVRIVDTRGEGGRSLPTALDDVPMILPGSDPATFAALVGKSGDTQRLIPLHLGEDRVELGEAIQVGSLAAQRVDGGAISCAFERDGHLTLFQHGEWEKATSLSLPPSFIADRFSWTDPGTILAMQRKPARMFALSVGDGSQREIPLPDDFAAIDGVSQSIREGGFGDPIAIGRNARGRIAIAAIGSDGPGPVLTLPRGAEFRSLSRCRLEDLHSPQDAYRIYYSLRGDPDELDRHRSVVFRLRARDA